MSILLAQDVVSPAGWVLLAGLVCAAIGAMVMSGVFRRRDSASIDRLFLPNAIGPVVINAGLAIFVYFGVAVLIGFLLGATGKLDPAKPGEQALPPGVLILFSVVVPSITLVGLVLGLKWIVPGGPGRLGLTRANRRIAILPAVGLIAASLPFILLIGNVAEVIYEHFGWKHPSEHPLLTSMGALGGLFEQACGVLAAVVLAPLSEEILFRGHLQTALRHLFAPKALTAAVPVAVVQPAIVAELTAEANAQVDAPEYQSVFPGASSLPPATLTFASVMAVLVTSVIFAMIHPDWSRPPIFVLSVFLGFAYERRGNLWTCIFMHALFNGIMVTAFLFMAHANP